LGGIFPIDGATNLHKIPTDSAKNNRESTVQFPTCSTLPEALQYGEIQCKKIYKLLISVSIHSYFCLYLKLKQNKYSRKKLCSFFIIFSLVEFFFS
jgi:hypothetical protein